MRDLAKMTGAEIDALSKQEFDALFTARLAKLVDRVTRLDVLPRDVVDAADRWPAAERAVGSVLVVVAEPV